MRVCLKMHNLWIPQLESRNRYFPLSEIYTKASKEKRRKFSKLCFDKRYHRYKAYLLFANLKYFSQIHSVIFSLKGFCFYFTGSQS